MKRVIILSIILFSLSMSQHRFHSYFESQISMEFDSTQSDGNNIGSFIRFQSQIDGNFELLKNTYSISGGGILLENFNNSKNEFSPEWNIKSLFTPLHNFKFRIFSRNIQYSPNQYISLPENKSESYHGVELQYDIKNNSSILFQNGLRNLIIGNEKSTFNFTNIEFHHRSKFTSLILNGNINSNDSLEYINQKIIINSFLKKGTQNLIFIIDKNELIKLNNISTSGVLPLTTNHLLQWSFNKGIRTFNENSIINQEYIFKYEYTLSSHISIVSKINNEWNNINGLDKSHWRQYHTGLNWNIHISSLNTLGGISFGFREDAIFGNGPSTTIDILSSYTPLNLNFMTLQLTNYINSSTLSPIKENSINKTFYEFDNWIDINTELYPNNLFVPGINLYINTHVGSDLTYSPDTLQNIINGSLYSRLRYKSTFFKISATKQYNIQSNSEKLIYSCDYKIYPTQWFSITGFARYQNNNKIKTINFHTTSTLLLGGNSIHFDLYHTGLVNNINKINTHFLIRFVRRFK
ncbi:MAG: hypothetical protein H8E60_06810 [Candidatus Marinimicrobia bacterium]|nr:hypothetical protein [Candidatus Neomarinimicrobiota bacterium]